MRKAGDILSSLFNEKFDPVFLKRARTTAGLFSSWAAVTDEAGIASAASHSWIAEMERGLLLIEAGHPGWVQILQTKQSQLLKAVQSHYPELKIRGIAFRLGRDTQPGAADRRPAEPQSLGPSVGETPVHALPTEPVNDENYLLSKKRLQESIKRRNKK